MLNSDASDLKFINYALNMAQNYSGNTAENPVVACVIVKNNSIISTGVTAQNGRPHAEAIAINKISDYSLLQGAEMFVTLEPCSHFGKTPPCIEKIITSGIKRVVICMQDIDSRVNGKGIEALRKAKIEVVVGIGETRAKDINRFFMYAKKHQKPWLTAKIATSLDAKIATKNLQSKWITGAKTRDYTNFLRSKHQAIMVGANTVKLDNPNLDCRISGLTQYSPLKIIVSNKADFSFQENVFCKGNSSYLVTSLQQQNRSDINFWLQQNDNNKVVFLPTINGKMDLNLILQKLYQLDINSILLEGGSDLLTQCVQKKLLQELIWIRSNKIIGDDGLSAIKALNFNDLNSCLQNLARKDFFNIEQDLIEVFATF